jgi:hypothetical protein
MGTVFPNNYPNATAPGVNYNAPMVSFTTRERYSFISYANGSNYSFSASITSRPKAMLTYATAFTAGAPSATSTIDSNAYGPMASAFVSSVCTGMEVIITNTLASSNIGGMWYAFPAPNTGIGAYNVNSSNQALAATGSFSDASPAFRYSWVRGDESDSDLLSISTAASTSESAIYVATVTPTNATFLIEVIHTWTCPVISSATSYLPVTNRMIDEGAYERGMAVIQGQVLAPSRIITNPAVADKEHPSLLRQVCDAVTNYAEEAKVLYDTVNNMAPVVTGIYNTIIGSGESDLLTWRHFATTCQHARRLVEILDDHKLGDDNLRSHLAALSKYLITDDVDRLHPYEVTSVDADIDSLSDRPLSNAALPVKVPRRTNK